MGRIFCIVGKSCSGKDTIYQRILAQGRPSLVPVVLGTTRPRRSGEVDGQAYHFVDEGQLAAYERAGQVIEKRQYHTTQGLWTYFTLKFDLEPGRDYILITTLEGAWGLIRAYGAERVVLVYLHVDGKTRLLRYIQRESLQASPDYAEVCRRYLADELDFAPERLAEFPALYAIDTAQPLEECLKRWDAILTAT